MTVSIHHGDWREVVDSWPLCVMITDPPFGQGYVSGWESRAGVARSVVGDDDTTERDAAMTRVVWSSAAVFGPRRIDRIPPWGDPREILILDKGKSLGMGDLTLPWRPSWETIAMYGSGWIGQRTSGVLDGATTRAGATAKRPNGRRHPNEKSMVALRELVAKAPPGLPICDPFMGSGTTGAAAIEAGRDFYGAEIDAEHFAVCDERLRGIVAKGSGQVGLFA